MAEPNSNTLKFISRGSVLAAGIFVCIYIFAKAAFSSFTHDESYSWLHYVHDSFFDIITYKRSFTNNHLLNTLGMKYSEMIFGNHEFALRLPNLLLFIVYLVYGFLLLRRSNKFHGLLVFLLLCTNNQLLDLFGLARGYGMSVGFMLMGFYHFTESFHSRKARNILLFHAGAFLAILSNFTLLTFYISLLGIYVLVCRMESFAGRKKAELFQSLKFHILPFITVFIILFEPVRRVIKFNNFDFGGKNGFMQDTVAGLVKTFFHNYDLPPVLLSALILAFFSLVLISTIIIIIMLVKRDSIFFSRQKGLIISNLLLLFISIIIILQHLFLKTDYPVGRFALFIYPIFVIHLGFLFSFLSEKNEKIILFSVLPLTAISVWFFVMNLNLYSCSEWGFDRNTKAMMQKLSDERHQKPEKIKLGIDWIFEPTVNYYREKMKLSWLLPADRNGLTDRDDYRYITGETLEKTPAGPYEVITEYKNSGTWLLRRKEVP